MVSQVDRESEKAEGFVVAVIVVGLFLELVNGVAAESDPTVVGVRLLLLAGLAIFVYQRAVWARWLLAILLVVVGFLTVLFAAVAESGGFMLIAVVQMISGGIWLVRWLRHTSAPGTRNSKNIMRTTVQVFLTTVPTMR